MVAKLQHRPLAPRQRVARQHPWPIDYDAPSPRGRAEACLHLLSAGLCPGYSLEEVREAWQGAGELEREALAIVAGRVAA
ncbi:hypothetical protein [Tomitella biformata]|uniref:hypothetical protein n=1 Tax=Tomitella biformata TaxID=630403 RepID=UPI0005713E3F|nr:hypothetical protein [Tomitella biformata]